MASIQERLEALRQGRPPQNSGTVSTGGAAGSSVSTGDSSGAGGSIAQRLERMRQDGIEAGFNARTNGGGYTPASTAPTYTQAEAAPLGAAMSAAVGVQMAKAAGPALAGRQDEIRLENLRKRAEELEAQYRQIDQMARSSRYRKYGSERAEAGELWRAARDEYERAAAEMGLAKPTFGERILRTLSGAGKQYLGSTWDTAGVMVSGGTAEAEIYQEQLESLYGEKQRTEEWLKQPEDEQERRLLENRLASLNEQISVYEALARESAGLSEGVRDAAAGITQSGAADLERAKYRAGKAGQLLVDAGAAGAQMAGDAALGYLTGFGSMAPMMVRSFGGGTQQAREKGYSQKQQIALGLSSAATEYFSEKLFGGNPVYDSDAGLVSKLVGKITSNETVLEYLASKPAEMLYEGLEEITADLLEPLAEQIIAGQHDELSLEQIIDDGIVGIMTAGVMQGGQKIVNTAGQKIGDMGAGKWFGSMGGETVRAGEESRSVSEEDYRRATHITSLDLWSKELKEIAQALGKTPAQTKKFFEEMVRDYNLAQHTPAESTLKEWILSATDEGKDEGAGETESAAPYEAAGDVTLVDMVRQAIPELQGMGAATEINGTELPPGDRMVDRLVGFINKIGNKVTRPGFGDVLFSKSRIKNGMVGHGAGQAKIEAFAAVPAVIQNGAQIDYQENWKGRKYDTYTFAAPVIYRGKQTYLGVIVTQDPKDSRYYVHEVVDADGNIIFGEAKPQDLPADGPKIQSGEADTVVNPVVDNSLAQGGENVNEKTRATDRSSTSHALDGAQVDISRPAVTPVNTKIAQSTADVNSSTTIQQRYPNTAARAKSAGKQQLRSAITRAWWTIDDLQKKGGLTEREAKSLEAARAVLEINQREYAGRYGEEYVPLSDGPTFPMHGEGGMMPEAELRTLTDEELAEVESDGRTAKAEVNENGLVAFSELEKSNLSSGKKNKIVSTFQEAIDFIKNVLTNTQSTDRAYMGKIPEATVRKVMDETGINISGYTAYINGNDVRHILKHHGSEQTEAPRGQVAVTAEDIAQIPSILAEPDSVKISPQLDDKGRKSLIFEKNIGENYVTVQAVSNGKRALETDTLFKQKRKNSQDTGHNAGNKTDPVINAQGEPSLSASFNVTIAQNSGDVNAGAKKSGTGEGHIRPGRSANTLAMKLMSCFGIKDAEAMKKARGLIADFADEAYNAYGVHANEDLRLYEQLVKLGGGREATPEIIYKADNAVRDYLSAAESEVKERTRAEKRIDEMKKQQAEKEQRARERRQMREEQDKVMKQLQWLRKNRRRMQGTEYQQQADEVLNSFNTWTKHMSNEMNVGEFKIAGAKFTGTWRDAVTLYRNAQKFDPNWLPSSSLEKLAQRIDPTLEQVGEMEPEALQDVYNFLTSLRHQWENRNRIIGEAEDTAISDVYHASVGEIKQASGGKATKGRSGFEKYLDSQLTPKNRIRKFVGWNPDSQFYKHTAAMLENAERRWKDYKVKAEAMLNAFKKEYGDWVKTSDGQGKNATWYEYEIPELLEWGKGDKPIFGDTVKVYMTPAQKVGLYLSSKGYDNLRHIAEGGISLLGEDGKKLYAKGNRQDAYAASSTFRLAPETVKELVKDLTPEEQALAKVMEEYFNDFSKIRINETSNIVDGFDRAMAAFYYPIVTDSDYNKQESGKFDATAKGVGHLKERLDYGASPIVGLSVFDVFDRHVDQTSKYYGFTIAEHNINRLMNWREGRTSMRDAMSHAWGAEAAKYVTDTLTELTSGRATEKGVGGKLLSNYVSSVFGANPGIVLKQSASFPTVAAVLGFDTMSNPVQWAKTDTSLIDIYTPELAYRSAGYGTPELAQLKNNPNWSQSNKAFKLIFGGDFIQAMDTATVKCIWSWSENYVNKHHAGLEVGTEEQIRAGESAYYKKVAEMFNKAVSETQPMYDTMNRADIMRNSNPAVRAFTMFKTVPVQQGNLIQKAIGEARWASKHGTEAQKKAAAKQLANTTVSILGATVMLEAIEFGNQMLKNAAKNYRDDDDDELTLKSAAEQFSLNVLKDLAGNFIGGSELCESMEKAWKGRNYSVLSMPGIEQLESAISMFTSAFGRGRELWEGFANISADGDADEYLKRYGGDMLGDVNDLAVNIGSLTGLPVANVQKYVTGILDLVSPKLGETYDAFFDTTTRADVKGKTGERLNVRVGALLDSRGIGASDDTVDELRRLYEATGNSAVLPHDTPSELGDTELTAAQQQEYDAAYRDALGNMLDILTGSEDYAGFDDAGKAQALKYLYNYAAAEAKAALNEKYELAGWMEPVSEGEIELNTAAQYYGAIKDLTKKSEKVAALRDMEISDAEKASVYYVYLATDKEAGLMDELYDKGRGEAEVFGLIMSLSDSKVSVDEYKKLAATGLEDDGYIISVAAAAAEKKVWDWRKIVSQGGDTDSTLKALSAYMSDSQYEKAELAIGQYGINPSMYVTVQEELAFRGGMTQADVTAAIDRVAGLNDSERAVLWQLCVSAKSSKNNPYDVEVGAQVLRELEG